MTAPGPALYTCYLCGETNASFRFSWADPCKDRPDDSMLWGCALRRDQVQRINNQRTGQGPSR